MLSDYDNNIKKTTIMFSTTGSTDEAASLSVSSSLSHPLEHILEKLRTHQQNEAQPENHCSYNNDETDEIQPQLNIIHSYGIQWRERLNQCVTNYCEYNQTSSNNISNAKNVTPQSWQSQYQSSTKYYMELYLLKQELQRLRQILLPQLLPLLVVPHRKENDNTTNMMITLLLKELDTCEVLLQQETVVLMNPKNPKDMTNDDIPFRFTNIGRGNNNNIYSNSHNNQDKWK